MRRCNHVLQHTEREGGLVEGGFSDGATRCKRVALRYECGMGEGWKKRESTSRPYLVCFKMESVIGAEVTVVGDGNVIAADAADRFNQYF